MIDFTVESLQEYMKANFNVVDDNNYSAKRAKVSFIAFTTLDNIQKQKIVDGINMNLAQKIADQIDLSVKEIIADIDIT